MCGRSSGMFGYKNSHEALIIVLHEIYGINPHIRMVCQEFIRAGFDVICPNLLNLECPFTYEQEDAAYDYFIQRIGFKSAASQIKNLLREERTKYRKIVFVGFSIGATTAWLCSAETGLCDGVIGWYGSRIRDFRNINPCCPVLLLFPEEEKSFDVPEIIASLVAKDQVTAKIFKGRHGFADPFSRNFNRKSYKRARRIAADFIRKILD